MGRKSRDLVPDASMRNGIATATLSSDEQGPRPRRVRRRTFDPSTSVKEMLSQ